MLIQLRILLHHAFSLQYSAYAGLTPQMEPCRASKAAVPQRTHNGSSFAGAAAQIAAYRTSIRKIRMAQWCCILSQCAICTLWVDNKGSPCNLFLYWFLYWFCHLQHVYQPLGILQDTLYPVASGDSWWSRGEARVSKVLLLFLFILTEGGRWAAPTWLVSLGPDPEGTCKKTHTENLASGPSTTLCPPWVYLWHCTSVLPLSIMAFKTIFVGFPDNCWSPRQALTDMGLLRFLKHWPAEHNLGTVTFQYLYKGR